MTNNDILRRIRFIFDFSDQKMMDIFALSDHKVTRSEVSDWMKKEEDASFLKLQDVQLATFLNGFIIDRRGPKEGVKPVAETRLNNNIIFRKLKIALDLKDIDVLTILKLVDFRLSPHELSAFFRKPTQSQYRPCQDQVLRNFLQGLQRKYRAE